MLGLTCFVCNEIVTGEWTYLASAVAPISKVGLAEKISQVIGERFVIVITEKDVICKRCDSSLALVDKLENELMAVKKALLGYIRKRYKLPIDDNTPLESVENIINDGNQKESEVTSAIPTKTLFDISNQNYDSKTLSRLKSNDTRFKDTEMKQFVPDTNLVNGVEMHKCNCCSFQSKELNDMRIHMKQHMDSNKEGESSISKPSNSLAPPPRKRRLFRCQLCSASFDSKLGCLEHINSDHSQNVKQAEMNILQRNIEKKVNDKKQLVKKDSVILMDPDVQLVVNGAFSNNTMNHDDTSDTSVRVHGSTEQCEKSNSPKDQVTVRSKSTNSRASQQKKRLSFICEVCSTLFDDRFKCLEHISKYHLDNEKQMETSISQTIDKKKVTPKRKSAKKNETTIAVRSDLNNLLTEETSLKSSVNENSDVTDHEMEQQQVVGNSEGDERFAILKSVNVSRTTQKRRRSFKCEVCLALFDDRNGCLEHIRSDHIQNGKLVMTNNIPQKSDEKKKRAIEKVEADLNISTGNLLDGNNSVSDGVSTTNRGAARIRVKRDITADNKVDEPESLIPISMNSSATPPVRGKRSSFKCEVCSALFNDKNSCLEHINALHIQTGIQVKANISELTDGNKVGIEEQSIENSSTVSTKNGENVAVGNFNIMECTDSNNSAAQIRIQVNSDGSNSESSPLPKPATALIPWHPKRRFFRCQLCSVSFDDKIACLEHISRDHTQNGEQVESNILQKTAKKELSNKKQPIEINLSLAAEKPCFNNKTEDSSNKRAAAHVRIHLKQPIKINNIMNEPFSILKPTNFFATPPPPKQLFRCVLCSASFDEKIKCFDHISRDHSRKNKQTEEANIFQETDDKELSNNDEQSVEECSTSSVETNLNPAPKIISSNNGSLMECCNSDAVAHVHIHMKQFIKGNNKVDEPSPIPIPTNSCAPSPANQQLFSCPLYSASFDEKIECFNQTSEDHSEKLEQVETNILKEIVEKDLNVKGQSVDVKEDSTAAAMVHTDLNSVAENPFITSTMECDDSNTATTTVESAVVSRGNISAAKEDDVNDDKKTIQPIDIEAMIASINSDGTDESLFSI